jgi:hypothetical protein
MLEIPFLIYVDPTYVVLAYWRERVKQFQAAHWRARIRPSPRDRSLGFFSLVRTGIKLETRQAETQGLARQCRFARHVTTAAKCLLRKTNTPANGENAPRVRLRSRCRCRLRWPKVKHPTRQPSALSAKPRRAAAFGPRQPVLPCHDKQSPSRKQLRGLREFQTVKRRRTTYSPHFAVISIEWASH